jgi:hypothetical protein
LFHYLFFKILLVPAIQAFGPPGTYPCEPNLLKLTFPVVTPEVTAGKVNFNKLGSQGYVAGGPKAWIAGTNKILKNK